MHTQTWIHKCACIPCIYVYTLRTARGVHAYTFICFECGKGGQRSVRERERQTDRQTECDAPLAENFPAGHEVHVYNPPSKPSSLYFPAAHWGGSRHCTSSGSISLQDRQRRNLRSVMGWHPTEHVRCGHVPLDPPSLVVHPDPPTRELTYN